MLNGREALSELLARRFDLLADLFSVVRRLAKSSAEVFDVFRTRTRPFRKAARDIRKGARDVRNAARRLADPARL
jgi:hypothetical protein